MALEGKAPDVARDVDKEKLASDEGCEDITKLLDSVFLQDVNTRSYLAFKSFFSFKRSSGMNLIEFTTQYEKLYADMKKYQMTLPEPVRAYMLLDALNIPEENEKLARATLDEVKYDNMKAKILRIFGDNSDTSERAPDVKIEPVDVYYTKSGNVYNNRGKGQRGRARAGRGERKGNYRGNNRVQDKRSFTDGQRECFVCKSKEHLSYQCPKNENRKKCFICDSPEHLADRCPNRTERSGNDEQVHYTLINIASEGKTEIAHTTLMNVDESNQLSSLVKDTLGMAILDSGCMKTVVGEKWLSIYFNMLDEKDKAKF